MRVAVAKPEWNVTGGFEVLLNRLIDHLTTTGHEVSMLTVAGHAPDHVIDGRIISDVEWAAAPEAYTYASLLDRFSRVDASGFDLVISTQPGSWAVQHPRKMAIFYHHQRVFYDLADVYARTHGLAPEMHQQACDMVRALDSRYVDSISRFASPSATVTKRLESFWGVDRSIIDQFHAGPISAAAAKNSVPTPARDRCEVICVSRSESTKRTDLFVAAAHHGFAAPATLIGEGGQLGSIRRWAAEKAAGLDVVDRPWERTPTFERVEVVVPPVPVDIVGRLSNDDLAAKFANAACLVAPAYNEDYGLTALEAFTHGVPVVVCNDGGGLVEFIDHGVNGLVVEPDPAALAAAVRSITADPGMAERLSQGALETAEHFTWDRAHAQLDATIAHVMSSPVMS